MLRRRVLEPTIRFGRYGESQRVEYLLALLTTLALQLPTLTGHAVPGEDRLPALEVVENVDQAVYAYTGQQNGSDLGVALYLPHENAIVITTSLLDDLSELEAVLVHELIHWWQVESRRPELSGKAKWEEEARNYESLWRRQHGVRARSTRILPTHSRP